MECFGDTMLDWQDSAATAGSTEMGESETDSLKRYLHDSVNFEPHL